MLTGSRWPCVCEQDSISLIKPYASFCYLSVQERFISHSHDNEETKIFPSYSLAMINCSEQEEKQYALKQSHT